MATRIHINLNHKLRRLIIADNGKGISVSHFNRILTTIADPNRSKMEKEGGVGQFAIGMISPLGKCRVFTFTSCPNPHLYGFNEWTFNCAEIGNQPNEISVPLRSLTHLTLSPAAQKGQQRVDWRTKIELTDISSDAYISKVEMDNLVGAIVERFANVMRKNKVVISITIADKDGSEQRRPNVQAPQFRGKPLPEYKGEGTYSGKVIMRLFVAPKEKGVRKGKIVMGTTQSDFRFPFHLFARSADTLLPEEVTTALMSGNLEGEIVASHVKMHPARKSFVKDDAFIELCLVLEEWLLKHGRRFLAEIKETTAEERYQELGLRSLKVLEDLLRNPAFEGLLKVIGNFRLGTVGTHHTKPTKKEIVEIQEQKSLSIDGKPNVPREPYAKNEETPEPKNPEAEKPEKIHLTATGPHGKKRRLVKRSSFGLQFTYEMKDSPVLWELDLEHGILSFNTRHPCWLACETKDTPLMKLQEFVAMQALNLYACPETFREHQRRMLDDLTDSFVHWLLNSDKARAALKK